MKEGTQGWMDLKEFLDEKAAKFNRHSFIETDPIQIPHGFTDKENIEIAAFLTATIAWGNRTSIIKNASQLMALMDNRPHDFVLYASAAEKKCLLNFVHRTFNGNDCVYFVEALGNIYKNHNGLQAVFENAYRKKQSAKSALMHFNTVFFELPGERTRKHVPNVNTGSAAKRLNMFLRWMVRKDNCGVDFGLWAGISSAELLLPLDVHTGKVARKLGLLTRKQNDWKAVEEVTAELRTFDADDPVKYDYALFGLGAFEDF